VWLALALAAVALGLSLILDAIRASSATYDEVAYLGLAARWWRTGHQSEITRMGSPLLFWKLQQVPVLWLLDLTGRGALIDDPIGRQAELLPLVRSGALWIWLTALCLCALWSRLLYGPRAMAAAAWLFALSPNLLAHGGLVTMELPLLACTTGMLLLFWTYLARGGRHWFWASAAVGGVAFSCKYTTILYPPILAVVWFWETQRGREARERVRLIGRILLGMVGYVTVMLLTDLAVTCFAVLPLSNSTGRHPTLETGVARYLGPWMARLYETPIPQDWVGLANQVQRQVSGGPSYLLGERRMTGWRTYYFIALAVKVPLTLWLLLAGRTALDYRTQRERPQRDRLLPAFIALFLAVAAAGSARNYGVRYLLPLAPLAIIWVSRLAETEITRPAVRARWPAWILGVGLTGHALAVASVHPFELTYFNALAGGPLGGRHILADSNLDWGQGLKMLAELQHAEPEFRDLTLYYFGDTDPRHYGVQGTAYVVDAVDSRTDLPDPHTVATRFLAVSASLQWGPWGPAKFFAELDHIPPVRMSRDTTIAIYRTEDLRSLRGLEPANSRISRGHVRARAALQLHQPAQRSSG
jgi:4-amino-4-deoxy-L-arabinose transferase-like glycosyltransferase